jgi:CheY-like chemotaxis protein
MAHILIVDDQPSIRDAMRLLLEPAGHVVSEAGNGREAMRALTPSIDLLVTDVLMPEMDGLELIRHVKHERGDLPILVITGGWNAPGDLIGIAEALGADRAMTKKAMREALPGAVHDLLTARASGSSR